MTHATIIRHSTILCCVEFAYQAATKDAVKALAGATYEDGVWIVPILHLPVLKLIFSTMTVAPEVVADYHQLLKRMLCDTMTSTGRKGEIGRHLAELHERHANGIAHVLATGWLPTPTPRQRPVVQPVAVAEAAPVVDAPDLAIWLRSSRRAVANEERKAALLAKRRRQPTR
jgi:hypothetical protein